MNDVQSLIDGLKIRTYDLADGKASRGTSCPLKRFNPKLTAKTISLSLTNAPDCDALFHDNADQRLGLELVNEVQFPTPYRKGIMVESWDHQILQSPLESMFWPRVEFGGSILIRSVQH